MINRLEQNKKNAVPFYDFRFDENDKIVEHGDVLPVIPDKSANDNTMF